MQNPFIVKLNAGNLPGLVKKVLSDPDGISDEERPSPALGSSPAEQLPSPVIPLAVDERRQRSEQRRPDAENGSAPNRPAVVARPVKVPTVEELRQKAQQCRADAERHTIPELRAHLLKIAGEYDRLAKRSEEFETRSSLPQSSPMNATALTHWFS